MRDGQGAGVSPMWVPSHVGAAEGGEVRVSPCTRRVSQARAVPQVLALGTRSLACHGAALRSLGGCTLGAGPPGISPSVKPSRETRFLFYCQCVAYEHWKGAAVIRTLLIICALFSHSC